MVEQLLLTTAEQLLDQPLNYRYAHNKGPSHCEKGLLTIMRLL
jgi:hypothetical protein